MNYASARLVCGKNEGWAVQKVTLVMQFLKKKIKNLILKNYFHQKVFFFITTSVSKISHDQLTDFNKTFFFKSLSAHLKLIYF